MVLWLIAAFLATPVKPSFADRVHWLVLNSSEAKGLSGLARDEKNHWWVVPERDPILFRIGRHGPAYDIVLRYDVLGIPDGLDMESLDFQGSTLLIGTESQKSARPHDSIFVLQQDQARKAFVVRDKFALAYEPFGIRAEGNKGLEGLCAIPGHVVVVGEMTKRLEGARWAPIWHVVKGRVRHVWAQLTSQKGKLSALTCHADDQRKNTVHLFAIERHYGVARLVKGKLKVGDDLVALTVVSDLAPAFSKMPNLEGLIKIDAGFAMVADNQSGGKIEGSSALVLLRTP